MNVFIIRHGEADNSSPDSSRRLTEQGKNKLIASIQVWKKKLPEFDYIIHSPIRRAEETAAIIEEYFETKNPRFSDEGISPGSYTQNLITIANSLEAENIAFVGHQPDCSMHVANLISDGLANVNFSPGTLAAVRFVNGIRMGAGRLEVLIPG